MTLHQIRKFSSVILIQVKLVQQEILQKINYYRLGKYTLGVNYAIQMDVCIVHIHLGKIVHACIINLQIAYKFNELRSQIFFFKEQHTTIKAFHILSQSVLIVSFKIFLHRDWVLDVHQIIQHAVHALHVHVYTMYTCMVYIDTKNKWLQASMELLQIIWVS